MKTTWTHFLRQMAAVTAIGASAMMASATNYAMAAASDNAGNAPYADDWQAGDNGGSGFGPWAVGYSGTTPLAHADARFIDFAPPLAGHSLGSPAFGLTTSNRAYYFDTSEVSRLFSTPLAVGQTFSMDVDGPVLSPGGFGFDYGVGAVIRLCSGVCVGGPNTTERFGIFSNVVFNPNWTATSGNDTGIPSPDSFHLEMTLITPNTYDLVITPVGGGAPLYTLSGESLGGPAGAAIDTLQISVYGTGSTADGSRELFFNNLSVVPEPGCGVLLVLGASGLAMGALRRKRD